MSNCYLFNYKVSSIIMIENNKRDKICQVISYVACPICAES